MENQWIEEKLTELKQQYSDCRIQEIALSRYIGCMIRMLNGLAHMKYSQFHYYERLILWEALEIFTEHFIEQIKETKNTEDTLKKRSLIDDIENAVDSMTGVYKNVIDSTANSDRQILSSISIDTIVYELSPKICAFYSMILNKLVKMFEGDDAKYAFVLHPTLKNNTETRVMFEQRKKSGKVVIIYISESIIERFDVVSVFISHEAFHVLTKEERMRKKRVGFFMQLMVAGISQVLFENVVFDEDKERNQKCKEIFIQKIFSDNKQEVYKWSQKEESSRSFYSNEVEQWGNGYFQKCLRNIFNSLAEYISETMPESFAGKNYDDYMAGCERREQIINQIRDNVSDALAESKVRMLAKRFMFIFREVFADIGCILTLQLCPEEYDSAFEESKQFQYDEKGYYDSTRTVRNYVVAASVARYLPEAESSKWNEYAQTLYNRLKGYMNETNQYGMSHKVKNSPDYGEYSEKNLAFSQPCVMIRITPQIRKLLLEYANGCAKAFSIRVKSIEDIQSFREFLSEVRNGNKKDWLMKKIMIGDFDEIY